jgi:hypothetical protein
MKAFKTLWLTFAVTSLFLISCSKDQQILSNDNLVASTCTTSTNTHTSTLTSTISKVQLVTGTPDATFCSPKTVSLCSSGISVGNITVQRGSDNNFYVTCSLTGSWYLAGIKLYAGDFASLPVDNRGNPQIAKYPIQQAYGQINAQQNTWVLANLPDSFAVSADITIAYMYKGRKLYTADVWADGCNGINISSYFEHNSSSSSSYSNYNSYGNDNHSTCGNSNNSSYGNNNHSSCGNNNDYNYTYVTGGETFFTYSSGSCVIPQPSVSIADMAPDACSQPIMTFFGTYSNGTTLGWPVDLVTVGGFDYTEADGRTVAGCADDASGPQDSKYAFERVATFKLSYTDYASDPTLNNAVVTIENWLAKFGKLKPGNLPTGNKAVKDAASLINQWIDLHNCPGRR